MRIRLWNAYASNNSGSYTIVGSFRDPAAAAAAADELRALCAAESQWQRRQDDAATRGGERPMVAFARLLGVTDAARLQELCNDWPDEAFAPAPSVAHVARQVVLHAPYTVGMPAELGLFLYHRGGRVDIELDHAHHPIVADLQLWGDWKDPQRDQRLRAALEALLAVDSELHEHAVEDVQPVVRIEDEHGTFVRALAVFRDLVAGITAVDRLVREHGLLLRVRLLEAEAGDPLRPWRNG